MKKCPDREKLYLFLDKELSAAEHAGLQSHIQKCTACQKEIKACQESENLVKDQVNDVFALCRSNEKIMAQIKSGVGKAAPEQVVQSAAWSGWVFKALGLAFAILLITALILVPQKTFYHGSVKSVSVQALGADSFAGGKLLMPGSEMTLKNAEKVSLSGHFLFSLPDSSSFSVKGSADVQVDNAKPVFSRADLEMLWVSGPGFEVQVDGQIVSLKAESAEPVKVGASIHRINGSVKTECDVLNSSGTSAVYPDKLIHVSDPSKSAELVATEAVEIIIASETVSADKKSPESSVFNKSPFAEEPVLPLNGN